ncbi:MAG: hypothetical protein QM784_40585 [Polyangiaceae bacterium]
MLDFLEWDEPREDDCAQDVGVVLASAEFSKELSTSVMWLNEKGIEVRCVRLEPYRLNEQIAVDVQQIIPLPEASDYQNLGPREGSSGRRANSLRWMHVCFQQSMEQNNVIPALNAIAERYPELQISWKESVSGSASRDGR